MSHGLKFGLLAGGVLVLIATSGFAARAVCRRASFFRVRQVEVTGVRHLSADIVLDALALDSTTSVCRDLEPASRRLGAFPGIAAVEVERRLPGTIHVHVVEVAPVAFLASQGELRVLDAQGNVLSFDPTVSALDLPFVTDADPLLLGILSRLVVTDPELAQQITSARMVADAAVLERGATRILLRPDATAEAILAISMVVADLDANGRAYDELDARFAGQIVVRLTETG